MGWLIEDGREDAYEHEGHLVAVVHDEGRWRELRFGDEPQDLLYVQVGCECGWRSRRLLAPLGTRWVPAVVVLPTSGAFAATGELSFDDVAELIWVQEHRLELGPDSLRDVGRDLNRRRGVEMVGGR